MKLSHLIFSSVFAISLQAAPLSVGSYEGRGAWKEQNSERGEYTIKAVVSEKKIETVYTLADGSTKSWIFEMQPTSQNGFFKLVAYGIEAGSGYCLNHSETCHYELKINDFVMEETLTVLGQKLYRFGSKGKGDERIVWNEALDRK